MTLQEYVDALRGKRVAVLGIGVSNTPLIDLLLDNGLPITVCDMRDESAMEDEAEILSTRGAELRLGPGYLDGLDGFDVIFRTPGLLPTDPHLVSAKEHGAVFLMGIGGKLHSGKPHDGRAPDYDDWDLNGDLLFWNEPLQCSYELSSMGIRVSPESMDRQLTAAGCDDRRELPFHKAVLNGELPYTIGGGIGQSRLCMLLLGSAHIGEVQASVWDNATREACEKAGIPLL